MSRNITEFQFQCIKVPRSEDTIDDWCTYPGQFCDAVVGICRDCLGICTEDRIPLSCLDICRGGLYNDVTAKTTETALEIDCTGKSWLSHESWFCLTLFLTIVLVVIITLWLTQRQKLRLQLKQAQAELPPNPIPIQETNAQHTTTRMVPGPETHTLLGNTVAFNTDETTVKC